jgi:CheY-like chemotaxis protein
LSSNYILVADDDLSILYLVADILREEGYTVEVARDGREALDVIARRDVPGLVILDMRMPVIDGWAFASTLRAQQIDAPILVMTAARNARQWAEEVGAAGYLAKPFDLEDFLREVSRLAPPPDTGSTEDRSLFALPSGLLGGAVRRALGAGAPSNAVRPA